mmetsp:Transcript_12998/g.27614  ORF Transcript_12998/g.27614 Transcript_12998/m.27614 type:complete len:222 (+) Transcript_12998:1007-1672(+)
MFPRALLPAFLFFVLLSLMTPPPIIAAEILRVVASAAVTILIATSMLPLFLLFGLSILLPLPIPALMIRPPRQQLLALLIQFLPVSFHLLLIQSRNVELILIVLLVLFPRRTIRVGELFGNGPFLLPCHDAHDRCHLTGYLWLIRRRGGRRCWSGCRLRLLLLSVLFEAVVVDVTIGYLGIIYAGSADESGIVVVVAVSISISATAFGFFVGPVAHSCGFI